MLRTSFVVSSSLLLLVVGSAAACKDDQCAVGEAQCEHSSSSPNQTTAKTCGAITDTEFGAFNTWSYESCGTSGMSNLAGAMCVVDPKLHRAFCVASQVRDERCAGNEEATVMNPSERCDGNTVLKCRGGYVLSETKCESGTTCVDGTSHAHVEAGDLSCSNIAFCAKSAEVDPLCAGGAISTCDGDTRVRCACGIRRDDVDCSSLGWKCNVYGETARTIAACGAK